MLCSASARKSRGMQLALGLAFVALCGCLTSVAAQCAPNSDHPDNTFEGMVARATAYGTRLEFTKAEECLVTAMNTFPDRVTAQTVVDLGTVLFYSGKRDEALQQYERALQAVPDSEIIHHNLAVIYALRGDEERAEVHRRAKWDLSLRARNATSTQAALAHLLRTVQEGERDAERLNAARMMLRNQVPGWHFPMIKDAYRNAAYDRALRKAVKRGDLVLDIGAGSGLLSMMAARAGAGFVVACEAKKPIADIAQYIVQHNGFVNIKVVPKHSTHLQVGPGGDLPQRADVLVSEIVDATLFGEGVLPSVQHAREHLLKPGAVIIPRRAAVMGVALEVPELVHKFQLGVVSGLDLSAFNLFHPSYTQDALLMTLGEVKYRYLSDPFVIFSVDFATATASAMRHDLSEDCRIRYHGTLQAIAIWFRMDLDDEITITNGPENHGNHWQQAVYLLPRAVEVSPGDGVPLVVSSGGMNISVEQKGWSV